MDKKTIDTAFMELIASGLNEDQANDCIKYIVESTTSLTSLYMLLAGCQSPEYAYLVVAEVCNTIRTSAGLDTIRAMQDTMEDSEDYDQEEEL